MTAIEVPAKDGAVIPALALGMDDDKTKAVIIICHGFGEHSGSYTELAEVLFKAGFASITHSQRGHGLPPEGAKNWHGRIPSYQCFVDDVRALTAYIFDKRPGTPIVLYGHSMGGNIVINTLLQLSNEQASEYACAVLESPWLSLYDQPGVFQTIAVRILNIFMPNFRIAHKMRSGDLSTIPERSEGYVKDPLYHGFLSARMITGIFDACSYAMSNAGRFPVDAFLANADGDTVVCNKAIRLFTETAGAKITPKEYKSKHAIHNDAAREEFIADMIEYINGHLR